MCISGKCYRPYHGKNFKYFFNQTICCQNQYMPLKNFILCLQNIKTESLKNLSVNLLIKFFYQIFTFILVKVVVILQCVLVIWSQSLFSYFIDYIYILLFQVTIYFSLVLVQLTIITTLYRYQSIFLFESVCFSMGMTVCLSANSILGSSMLLNRPVQDQRFSTSSLM